VSTRGVATRFIGSPLTTIGAVAILLAGLAAGMSEGSSVWR
jgi:hypothetical protein